MARRYRLTCWPAGAARTAAGRRGGRGGAFANHRFARLRSAPALARGPGFRPLVARNGSATGQLAQHVLQQAAVVGEEARLRTTGSRASAAPPRWRGGRASAHWWHETVQRPASWRSTYCSRPPWWARRRVCEPPVRAPPQRPRAGAGAGLPPIGGTKRFSDPPAGAARTAAGRRGGSTRLPSGSAASPTPRRSSSCRRPWSRSPWRACWRRLPGR